jgi:pyruvate/2-oxoglutarate dehydrogenase complex dihydrolipoamide dehydrogenase (E3) component
VTELIKPLDEYNVRHLSQVHPSGYVNPKPKERYHLVVIGAGPGGLVTAAAGAALGAKVALIERHLMGGDCTNVGCVPSKAMIRSARAWHEARHGAERFGAPAAGGAGDFGAVMERMRRLRAHLSRVDSVDRFSGLGVDVFLGTGRFTAPDAIEVGGARLRFRRAVIATGARAALPPIPGLAEAGPLTNETIFWLTELPRRLLVIGAGPIGCELSQAFARLGSKVTLANRGAQVLPREDRDAARIVEKALVADGVDLRLGSKLLEVRREGGEAVLALERGGKRETVAADAVLVAAGRTPNVEDLGADAAGVALGEHGVVVDDRLRTTNPRVYALGDVCSRLQFTHVSDAHARMVVQNALFFGRAKASRLVIPWCTYTSPEVAHVGRSAADAAKAGLAIDTVTVPLEDLDRAVLDDATEGFARVLLKKGTDRILGATIVAEHAGDLIAELALAITAGTGLGAIAGTIHPYPTQAEIVRKTADAWRRTKLTPTVKRIFAAYFRLV